MNKPSVNAGEKNSMAKLTKTKVSRIRKLLNEGEYMQKDIARAFGVKAPTIHKIKNFSIWPNVEAAE